MRNVRCGCDGGREVDNKVCVMAWRRGSIPTVFGLVATQGFTEHIALFGSTIHYRVNHTRIVYCWCEERVRHDRVM